MKSTMFKMGLAGLGLGLLMWSGCSVSVSTDSTSDSTPATIPPPADNVLAAGEYCYSFKDETLSLTASVDYDGSKVTGTLWGDIQDQANSYFTTYTTTFTGTRSGDKLDVSTKTEIEGDVQEEKASWAWNGKTLTESTHKMDQVDCAPHE